MARSPKVRISPRHDGQQGLFAVEAIRCGEILIEYDGPRLSHPTRYSLQIDDGLHIEGTEETNAYLNHACEPTAYNDFSEAPGRVVLRSIRDLAVGQEITVDYNAYDYELFESFSCACGSARCYGQVRGFKFLNEEQRRKLLRFLPPHLRKFVKGENVSSPAR